MSDEIERKTKVFMSYSRRDTPFVEELKISLETYGFEVTYDQEDIAAGEPWEPRLRNLINQAETTVCIVSRNWVASRECVKELDIALERGRRILPVITEPITPENPIPEELSERQFIFFHGEKYSYARAVADLIDALRQDVVWVREQTRLLSLAGDWSKAGKSDALRLRGEALEAAKAWQARELPSGVTILPIVAEFIGASDDAERQDQRKRLRARLWQVGLAGAAMIGVMGTGAALLWGELRLEEQANTNLEFALNAPIAPADCDRVCEAGQSSVESEDVLEDEPSPSPPRTVPAQMDVTDDEQRAADQLVARLNATDSTVRLQTGQAVANALRNQDNRAVLRALINQLEEPRRSELSSSGLFNTLYMLNLAEGWAQAGIRDQMTSVMSELEDSGRLGNQTRDCVEKMNQRLNGVDGVSRTCGGR